MHVAFFLTLINKMMNKNLIYVYFYACSCMSPVGLIDAITQLIKFRIVQFICVPYQYSEILYVQKYYFIFL